MPPRLKAATCRRSPNGEARPTTNGGAFGDWRLLIANLMALFRHAPILAHSPERRDAMVISPVILEVIVTSEIRLKEQNPGKKAKAGKRTGFDAN